MLSEPVHTALKESQNSARNAINVILCHNLHSNNQLCKLKGRWPLCFVFFAALQIKNCARSVSAINPVTMENTGG